MITTSPQIDKIAQAMCSIQEHPIIIGKDTAAYKYKYATLDKCVERIFPILSQNGLSVLQPLCDINGEPGIATIIMHTSGQFISSTFPLSKAGMAGVNQAQDFGAAISYCRRYGLLSAFGVPTGEDDDAQSIGKPAPVKRAPAKGQKYGAADPTPADQIIEKIGDCEDLQELTTHFEGNRQTIMDSPRKDQILSESSVRRGELEGKR